MREFSRSLPMALLRSREAVMRHFRPPLRDHGLTEQQWRILRALTSIDQIEVSELARVTYLLGRACPASCAIWKGVISCSAGRRKAICAAASSPSRPAGLAVIEAVAPVSEAIYAEITRRYGAKKLEMLQGMLRELETELLAIPVANAGDDETD